MDKMNTFNNTKPYQEILDVMERHGGTIKDRHGIDIRSRIKDLIRMLDVFSEFSICARDRQEPNGSTYYKISDHQDILLFGKDYNRTVAWLDEGEQPENEWLYCIGFPTGAYIFGQDYPTKTFNAFFNKLKSYGPRYCDSHNHSMYFSKENAAAVHKDFNLIMEEYRGIARKEILNSKADKIRKELAAIEGTVSQRPKEGLL